MKDMTYITRKADRDAWMVRVIFYSIDVRCSKSFSDAVHGGKDGSLQAAMAFRDEFVAQWQTLAEWQTEANRNGAVNRRREYNDKQAIAEARTLGEAKRVLTEAEQADRRKRNAVYIEAARADVQRVLTMYGVRP